MPRGTYCHQWCFTWNNYPDELTVDDLKLLFAGWVGTDGYLIFQREVGASGTPHIQGYCEFSRRLRLTQTRALEQAGSVHWESRSRNSTREEARDYCRKDDTRADGDAGPWEIGTWTEHGQGARTDLEEVANIVKSGGNMKRIAEEHPESVMKYDRGIQKMMLLFPPVRVEPPVATLYYGEPGCGKTRMVFHAHPEVWNNPLGGCMWFDAYDYDKHVLFDDFCGKMSGWRLDDFLRTIDRYNVRAPIKGGHVNWCPSDIHVTTNIHPRDWWDWTGRSQQWPALVRRFSRVVWWRRASAEPVVLHGGRPVGANTSGRREEWPEEWRHFWDGPQTTREVMRVVNGREVPRFVQDDIYDY